MIHLRNATADDFELTFSIKKASIKPHIEQIWGWDEQVQLDFHMRDFKPEEVQILVNEQGRDVGMLSVIQNEKTICIKSILIAGSAQGKGLGTAVLSDLIEQAATQGQTITLQVFKINHRAKALYQKLGFKTVSQTECHEQMAI